MGKQHETFPGEKPEYPVPEENPEISPQEDPAEQEDPQIIPDEYPPENNPQETPPRPGIL
ncbi:hypothetical protein [Mucilaginibacter lappiensis]|uniref:hypothetical protein n=1 Tax=Mucilaginibacter lappiensis TaxID=354630 RepID=UPI003D216F01